MIAHQTPSVYLQTFVLYAILKTINKNIFVCPPGENINPINRSERDKIEALLISYFVAAAHTDSVGKFINLPLGFPQVTLPLNLREKNYLSQV
ncbi:hypothetical protein [Rufibacter roseus]|uniref:hypothetical protein n=1 Tax=Rufibacter roseus TaxID=1567108 RepID=UPI00366DDD54